MFTALAQRLKANFLHSSSPCVYVMHPSSSSNGLHTLTDDCHEYALPSSRRLSDYNNDHGRVMRSHTERAMQRVHDLDPPPPISPSYLCPPPYMKTRSHGGYSSPLYGTPIFENGNFEYDFVNGMHGSKSNRNSVGSSISLSQIHRYPQRPHSSITDYHEVEFLREQVRRLKAENECLKRRVSELEKNLEVYTNKKHTSSTPIEIPSPKGSDLSLVSARDSAFNDDPHHNSSSELSNIDMHPKIKQEIPYASDVSVYSEPYSDISFQEFPSYNTMKMADWDVDAVQRWLTEFVGLSKFYLDIFNRNVKSGKALENLTDKQLEKDLEIWRPLVRRKIILAINTYLDPEKRRSCVNEISNEYLVQTWLPDLGLRELQTCFRDNFVDGRVLGSLKRQEIKKAFSLDSDFKSMSVHYGIKLLRTLNFDLRKLERRRDASNNIPKDPLVWTNERIKKWLDSISLNEYSDQVRSSCIHGAYMVLTKFDVNILATAIGISSKSEALRGHLKSNLDNLLNPAREAFAASKKISSQPYERSLSMGRLHGRQLSSSNLSDALSSSIHHIFGSSTLSRSRDTVNSSFYEESMSKKS